jgi:hypothetical protein
MLSLANLDQVSLIVVGATHRRTTIDYAAQRTIPALVKKALCPILVVAPHLSWACGLVHQNFTQPNQ